MRRTVPLLLAIALACGGEGGDRRDAQPDTAARDPVTPAEPAEERMVVLRGGRLRLAPESGSDAVTEVGLGTVLRPVADTIVGGRRWIRLATWDDRAGWMRAEEVLPASVWAFYRRSLGIAPTDLRPTYPIGRGRWGVEVPFPSSAFDLPARAWVGAETLVKARVVERDTVINECSGDRYSFAIVVPGPGEAGDRGPETDRAALAVPTDERPGVEPLAVEPLAAPSASAVAEAEGVAERALGRAAERGTAGPSDAPPPPAPGSEPDFAWLRVGEAIWVVAIWNPHDKEIMPGRYTAAWLFSRGEAAPALDGGRTGFWTVHPVVPFGYAFVGPAAPPYRPLAGYATGRSALPAVLVIEALEYEGSRIELLLAGSERFRRFYRGYYWGC